MACSFEDSERQGSDAEIAYTLQRHISHESHKKARAGPHDCFEIELLMG